VAIIAVIAAGIIALALINGWGQQGGALAKLREAPAMVRLVAATLFLAMVYGMTVILLAYTAMRIGEDLFGKWGQLLFLVGIGVAERLLKLAGPALSAVAALIGGPKNAD
jgi:hypothetical protein